MQQTVNGCNAWKNGDMFIYRSSATGHWIFHTDVTDNIANNRADYTEYKCPYKTDGSRTFDLKFIRKLYG